MSKYDFGWNLKDSPTNMWAYQRVFYGARVLELGAATGGLTRYLAGEKKCKVDIVELDSEAGKQAARYADTAVLGNDGDLNQSKWAEIIKGEYDYIIMLDVLEHLMFPEKVVLSVKEHLKPTGELLLSIPNIAHNAVVVELLNDDFPYQELGLLDNTHIHFFAYKSILRMLQNVDMCIKEWTAIERTISDTELGMSYKNVDENQAYLLEERDYGNAYQYLMVITRDSYQESVVKKPLKCRKNMYMAQILVNGLSKNTIEKSVTFGKQKFEIDLSKFEDVTSLRLIPCQEDAFIFNISARLREPIGEIEVDYNWTTGVELEKGSVCFCNSDSREVNFLIEGAYSKFEVQWECVPVFYPDGINIAQKILAVTKNKDDAIELQTKRVKEAYKLCDRISEEKNDALQMNAKMQKQLQTSEKRNRASDIHVEQLQALLKEAKSELNQKDEENKAEKEARSKAELEIERLKRDLKNKERECIVERDARNLAETRIHRISRSIDEHRIKTAVRIALKKPICNEYEEKRRGES